MEYSSQSCSDCGSRETYWISLNNFVILCNKCAKMHFQMGSSFSEVYHFNQIKYIPAIYSKLFTRMWQDEAYGLWVENLSDILELNPSMSSLYPSSTDEERRKFIKYKYQDRLFISKMSNLFEADIEIKRNIIASDLYEIFRSLIHSANMEVKDSNGDTLMHLAVAQGDDLVMTLLYLWGGDLYSKNSHFESCIECARESQNVNMINVLIQIVMEIPDLLTYYLSYFRPDHSQDIHVIIPNSFEIGLNDNVPNSKIKEFLATTSTEQFTDLVTDIFEEVARRLCNMEHKNESFTTTIFEILPLKSIYSTERNQFRASLSEIPEYNFAILVYQILYELYECKSTHAIFEQNFVNGTLPVIKSEKNKRIFEPQIPIEHKESNDIDKYVDNTKRSINSVTIIEETNSSTDISTSKDDKKKLEEQKLKKWMYGIQQIFEKFGRTIDLIQRSAEAKNILGIKKSVVEAAKIFKTLITYCGNSSYSEMKNKKVLAPLIDTIKNLNESMISHSEDDNFDEIIINLCGNLKTNLENLKEKVRKIVG